MHNKEKLHKKYLIQKKFLFKKVRHEIFQRNKNIIKKTRKDTKTDYFTHPGLKRHEKNMEKKIIQITKVNKRFTLIKENMKIIPLIT